MGAEPAWLTLALTLPEADEAWLAAFSDSLFMQLNYYDMQLIGGDTTRGPLSMTTGIHGFVPPGRALKRSGAKRRLDIRYWHPGDSAAGLAILQDRLVVESAADADYLLARHLRPMPRVLQGQALRDLASSAIDLSDGLISDLGHILKASGAARIDLDAMPLSDALLRHAEESRRCAGRSLAVKTTNCALPCLNLTAARLMWLSASLGRFTCMDRLAPRRTVCS